MTTFHNYINGEWLAGVETRPNINPSDTNEVIGDYAQADVAQTEVAIAAATAAFPAWAAATPQLRFDVLDAVGSELLRARTRSAACCRAKRARPCPKTSASRCARQ